MILAEIQFVSSKIRNQFELTMEPSMVKQNLIYERAVSLSTQAHKNFSIDMSGGYSFSKHVNSVPILAEEFMAASTDCVVVFSGSAGDVFPAVLLSAESNQNKFVDESGAWTGLYVPAFLRRYPFVFTQGPEAEQLTLCIDEEFEGANSEGLGERLFSENGTRTQYLESKLQFAVQYQNQHSQTKEFCMRLIELDLLEPAVANFNGDASQPRSLSGFFRINREKLKAIPPQVLNTMFEKDELELCYIHLQSFRNLHKLA